MAVIRKGLIMCDPAQHRRHTHRQRGSQFHDLPPTTAQNTEATATLPTYVKHAVLQVQHSAPRVRKRAASREPSEERPRSRSTPGEPPTSSAAASVPVSQKQKDVTAPTIGDAHARTNTPEVDENAENQRHLQVNPDADVQIEPGTSIFEICTISRCWQLWACHLKTSHMNQLYAPMQVQLIHAPQTHCVYCLQEMPMP